jgi:hypothetical protein
MKEILEWVYTAKPELRERNIQEVSKEDISLWKSLMDEETDETLHAIENNSKTELIDGVWDIIWVAANIACMAGVTEEEFKEHGKKVEESNFSKYCDNEQDAETTINLYLCGKHPDKPLENIDSYWKKVGSKYVILRKSDNKILKSFKFKKP